MRKITHIVLHCTATPRNTTPESIQRYWREEKKWKNPGYHWLIPADGKPIQLLAIDKISNGVAGYNSTIINISYIGGIDEKGRAVDNRTTAQKLTQIQLVKDLLEQFPEAEVCGHRDFPGVTKECPSFDAKSWWQEVTAACP